MKAGMTILSIFSTSVVFVASEARGTPGIRTQDEQSMNVLEDMIQNYANAGGLDRFFFPLFLCIFLCFSFFGGEGPKQSGFMDYHKLPNEL